MARTEAVFAGLELPPFGSFRDRLLEEMSYRRRIQRFVELSAVLGILGTVSGARPEVTKYYLELIESVLNHRAYLPGVLESLAVNQETWTREEEMKALKEIDKWQPE